MKQLRLNVDELNDDFFEETRLLGITAPLKNYQFCLQLNNQLGYDFRLNPDIEIHLRKKERSYYFSVYQSNEPNSFLAHYLYHNQFDGEYLLPEFKHMDFLWLMKDGDIIRFAPPLVINEDQIHEACDIIEKVVIGLEG